MRFLVAASLLTLTLAGCTAPAEPQDPLFGVCPQWIDGDSDEANLSTADDAVFDGNDSMEHLGRQLPLDRYHVVVSDIASDGVLELRATAVEDGRTLRFVDHRDPATTKTPTFLALDEASGAVEVDLFLADVAHGTQPMPSAVRFDLTGQGNATGSLHLTVTTGYRVCGAPL